MAKKYNYINESDADHTIVGVGFVVSGAEVETDSPIEHPDFKEVKQKKEVKKSDE